MKLSETKKRKVVTMADIASAAGVSITTVSHVVNHTASISKATTERIEQTIKQLGYLPKNSPLLHGGASRIIGVLAPDISNEFYSRSIQAICEEAWLNDYTVLVCGLRHDQKAEIRHIKTLLDSKVGGIIFFGGFLDERHIINTARHVPVVLGDRYLLNHSVPSVITDNASVMRRLTAKLAQAGYQKVGLISEDLEMSNMRDRYFGFKTGLEENNIPVNTDFIHSEPSLRLDKMTNAYKFIKERLKNGCPMPEVYCCSSDLIALGVMAALREAQYRIPRDIGVVGFDDITFAARAFPPLTTIAQNMALLGKTCFHTLSDMIEDRKDSYGQHIVLSAQIIVRESVRL